MDKKEIIKQIKSNYEVINISLDKRHRYKVDGEFYAGVTSISDYSPKPFLTFWSAKMVTEYLKPKLEEVKEMTQVEWEKLLQEAKTQHTKRSKGAMETGTSAHKWIEEYLKGNILEITEDIEHPVKEFLRFQKKHKIQYILSEKIVYSVKHKIAGTLDLLVYFNGKLSVLDLKTSNQIDEGYFLQTAGYQMCLEEMGIEGIEQRIILRLPKNIKEEYEAIKVPTDYESDKEAFLHRRYSFHWNNYIESQFKKPFWYYSDGRKQKGSKLELKKM